MQNLPTTSAVQAPADLPLASNAVIGGIYAALTSQNQAGTSLCHLLTQGALTSMVAVGRTAVGGTAVGGQRDSAQSPSEVQFASKTAAHASCA